MLSTLKKWSAALCVVCTALGMLLHWNDPNMFAAYVTGFTGWLVIATNEFIPEKSNNES